MKKKEIITITLVIVGVIVFNIGMFIMCQIDAAGGMEKGLCNMVLMFVPCIGISFIIGLPVLSLIAGGLKIIEGIVNKK